MHEMCLCSCRIAFKLTATTPLLVGGAPRSLMRTCSAQGKARVAHDFDGVEWTSSPAERNLVTVSFHRYDQDHGLPTYLVPASSLRGVFRHYLWRTIETAMREEGLIWKEDWKRDSGEPPAEGGSQEDWDREFGPAPLRQVFGSTARRGLVTFRTEPVQGGQDQSTYSGSNIATETELGGPLRFITQIQVDRFTHAATRGTRNIAPLEKGSSFDCFIEIQNFSWWMVGAMLLTLDAMNDGRVTIGSKGSVGFGRVQVSYKDTGLQVRYHVAVPVQLFPNDTWFGYRKILENMGSPILTAASSSGVALWYPDPDDLLIAKAQGGSSNPRSLFFGKMEQISMDDGVKQAAIERLKKALKAMSEPTGGG